MCDTTNAKTRIGAQTDVRALKRRRDGRRPPRAKPNAAHEEESKGKEGACGKTLHPVHSFLSSVSVGLLCTLLAMRLPWPDNSVLPRWFVLVLITHNTAPFFQASSPCFHARRLGVYLLRSFSDSRSSPQNYGLAFCLVSLLKGLLWMVGCVFMFGPSVRMQETRTHIPTPSSALLSLFIITIRKRPVALLLDKPKKFFIWPLGPHHTQTPHAIRKTLQTSRSSDSNARPTVPPVAALGPVVR